MPGKNRRTEACKLAPIAAEILFMELQRNKKIVAESGTKSIRGANFSASKKITPDSQAQKIFTIPKKLFED